MAGSSVCVISQCHTGRPLGFAACYGLEKPWPRMLTANKLSNYYISMVTVVLQPDLSDACAIDQSSSAAGGFQAHTLRRVFTTCQTPASSAPWPYSHGLYMP